MSQSRTSHLSERQLRMAIDDELSTRETECVESHLATCWPCRARKQEIRNAMRAVTLLDSDRCPLGLRWFQSLMGRRNRALAAAALLHHDDFLGERD